jgi:hypothetical protein
MTKAPVRRCAVYTRKSSEEGLEQDFNSLHAQREACEAFIRSQRGEGWRLIETAYAFSLLDPNRELFSTNREISSMNREIPGHNRDTDLNRGSQPMRTAPIAGKSGRPRPRPHNAA